jgi:hypothetical protein
MFGSSWNSTSRSTKQIEHGAACVADVFDRFVARFIDKKIHEVATCFRCGLSVGPELRDLPTAPGDARFGLDEPPTPIKVGLVVPSRSDVSLGPGEEILSEKLLEFFTPFQW